MAKAVGTEAKTWARGAISLRAGMKAGNHARMEQVGLGMALAQVKAVVQSWSAQVSAGLVTTTRANRSVSEERGQPVWMKACNIQKSNATSTPGRIPQQRHQG